MLFKVSRRYALAFLHEVHDSYEPVARNVFSNDQATFLEPIDCSCQWFQSAGAYARCVVGLCDSERRVLRPRQR
jgi:hypothetical protein